MTPPYPSHPPIGPTRVPRALIIGTSTLTLAIASWALWPLGSAEVVIPEISSVETTAAERTLNALDVDAFRTPVWVAANSLPEPPPSQAPPPPLRVQLLAILREPDGYRAALYDPDSDRLLIVKAGDRIASHTVEAIRATEVAMRDERGVQTLTLRSEGGTP